MEKKRFQVGSIAVLFSVVALCVAVFALLTVVTAASDYRVSRQYGDHVQALYQCENRGQLWLAQVDAWLAGEGALPEGAQVSGDRIETEIPEGSLKLQIRLSITNAGYEIQRWSCTTQWQPAEQWNLWQDTGEENGN